MSRISIQTEKKLREVFRAGVEFSFENQVYSILTSAKPVVSGGGECKTDIYILARNKTSGKEKAFKISVKQTNAEFLENKMTSERAEALFGVKSDAIISGSIQTIKHQFDREPIVFFNKRGNTNSKSITLGWRFELFNKRSGNKSGLMVLSPHEKLDVFAGTNLEAEKRNAKVNGEIIQDSGIANYMLEVGSLEKNQNQYVNDLMPVEAFAEKSQIFFGCRAVNYRVERDKWEGDRSLAVYVEWTIRNNKLVGKAVYNNTLRVKANEVGDNIKQLLSRLGIKGNNFEQLKPLLDSSVITFP